MPSGNTVFLHFGILSFFLSSFLGGAPISLAAPKAESPPPYIVVIDPGHGGADRGTSMGKGRGRVSEKEIALGIALRASRILEDAEYWKPLGRAVKVILTRKKDKDISLDARSKIGREAKADLFLSIHANSDPSRRASGLETYFLNNTDDTSLSKLEQIENKVHGGGTRDSASLLIRSVAADAVVETSRQAANTVHQSLLDHLRGHSLKVNDRGVRQGMFYVLLDAQVPAVLLEAFFLSDPKDREFVMDPDNRQKIAEGIAKGVLRFLALR